MTLRGPVSHAKSESHTALSAGARGRSSLSRSREDGFWDATDACASTRRGNISETEETILHKEYQLVSNEPLNDFEISMLKVMQDVADEGVQPEAAVLILVDRSTETVSTHYYNATLWDMMLARDFLSLDINADGVGSYRTNPEDEGEYDAGED